MKLITGGAYQGKLAYAVEMAGLGMDSAEKAAADCENCTIDEMIQKPIALSYHLFISRMMKEEKGQDEIWERTREILGRNPEIIIIVDELGCGVVPVDAFERRYREVTGRICCMLAKEAEEVHRVICGIGTVIKGG